MFKSRQDYQDKPRVVLAIKTKPQRSISVKTAIPREVWPIYLIGCIFPLYYVNSEIKWPAEWFIE